MSYTKEYILRSLKKGIRPDGRKLLEYRKIEIKTGISANPEGSASIQIGETKVLCGIKLAVEKPYPDTADQGGLMAGVELLPLSSPKFETGPPPIDAIEYSRVVDRAIREGHAFDTKELCIKEGEKAWFVFVDICPINAAGNLFDTTSLAALVALKATKMPEYDEETGFVDYKHLTDQGLPMKSEPLNVTVWKIGEYLIVDPTVEEEEIADARLTVGILEDGNLCSMQKGGLSPLSAEEIMKMTDIAIEKSKELRTYIK
ncbi:exosome complex protein Rrp42 [Nanoarchaeota archaeon]